jgi:hypothetical protein
MFLFYFNLFFALPHTPTFSLADQLYLGNQWTATSDDAMSALKITVRPPLHSLHTIMFTLPTSPYAPPF